MDNRPIGLLDSGLGGLSVLKQVKKALPNESTIYVGDQAHLPYGNKTVSEITTLTQKLVDFLISKNVKLIIFACNTATATALETIQKRINIPIIGVISAGSLVASKATKTKKIAIIATKATIDSKAYEKALKSMDQTYQVTALATPELVPAIENNQENLDEVISTSLVPLKQADFDTLILGCTHYPLIQNRIKHSLKEKAIQIVDPAEGICQQISLFLSENDAFANQSTITDFGYTTGEKTEFEQAAKTWLGLTFDKIEKVDL